MLVNLKIFFESSISIFKIYKLNVSGKKYFELDVRKFLLKPGNYL